MPEGTRLATKELGISTEAVRHLIDTPLSRIANMRANDPLGRGDAIGWLRALHEVMEEYQTAIDAIVALGPEWSEELTTDLQRKIVALHAAGKTVMEIARETGSSRDYSHETLTRLGLKPNVQKAQIPDLTRRQIINNYKAGDGPGTIVAKIPNITLGQVRSTLRWAARRGLVEYSTGSRK